jgi:chromosomal replication initiation ATPase DnaA
MASVSSTAKTGSSASPTPPANAALAVPEDPAPRPFATSRATTDAELLGLARERVDELEREAADLQRQMRRVEADLRRWRRLVALARALSPTEVVVDVVIERYGVTREQLIARTREHRATAARQVAMRLVREFTGRSYTDIGRAFHRNHSTVMHALAATEHLDLDEIRAELTRLIG